MTRPTKRIVFSCGGKGGVGKTTVAISIADYYVTRAIPAVLFDCDTENKSRGSLSHFFPQATKLDIRSERGLDRFVDAALAAGAPVALADLAAGSGRDTFHWFDTMFEALGDEGIAFTAVATITSAASSVESLFTWADALRSRELSRRQESRRRRRLWLPGPHRARPRFSGQGQPNRDSP